MPEWLSSRLPEGWTGWHVTIIVVVFSVTSAVVSLAVVGYVLGRLPADYFVNPAARVRQARLHPVAHVLLAVGRNLAGYFLIGLGAILSLPGVPGQGLLTILMGVMLIDLPGKHRVERWLITRRAVLTGVNKLRAKLGRPPLLTEPLPVGAGMEGGVPSPGGEVPPPSPARGEGLADPLPHGERVVGEQRETPG